jgi:hypothetical protein
MNMATEPIAPTMSAAGLIIAIIKFKALMAGLCIKFWSAPEVAGFWAIESEMMFMIMKRTKPRTDAKRRNMNFLAVRQGWANARTKAIAASKASSTPGRLSSIPTMTEALVDKPQTTKRTSVLILLRDVEKALIMTISFLIMDFVYGCPTDRRHLCLQRSSSAYELEWWKYTETSSLTPYINNYRPNLKKSNKNRATKTSPSFRRGACPFQFISYWIILC